MNRLNQIILIGSFIGFSWLAMQAAHEFGHVLGALATGGKVTAAALERTIRQEVPFLYEDAPLPQS